MIYILLRTLFSTLRSHRALTLENLALRHQLNVLQRNTKKPRLKNRDRLLWAILASVWSDWRRPLILVQSETVTRWHKNGVGCGRASSLGIASWTSTELFDPTRVRLKP